MAVKTDMSKAYDRLEWGFIKAVMDRMGFNHTWIQWIMQCINTVEYSYLLNGQARGVVTPERGIRQGDPLSPYLFIMCSEVLSGLCSKAQSQGDLLGIRVATNSPRVNHLLFADDTMFFCHSDAQSCSTLKSILQLYENASGQQINQDKSSITFSAKTPSPSKEVAKRILGIQKEGGQGKYLGLPELFGRKKKYLFTAIVDRIKQKALSWSSKFLSSAGKLTMLKDIPAFNDALLAKISLCLLTCPTCLLARVLLGKYCQNSTLLNCAVPNSASHGWRSICIGRDLFKTNVGRLIGSGRSTPLWSSPWLSLDTPLTSVGPPTEDSALWTVADLIEPGSSSWNIDLIRQVLPAYESEILKLKPSKQGAIDKWAWLPSQDGIYSTKSGYYTAQSDSSNQSLPPNHRTPPPFNWHVNIWNLKTSQKTKMLLWKIIQQAIPVGANLTRRKVAEDSKCPHCNATESELHLFFTCPFAIRLWNLGPFSSTFSPEQLSSTTEGLLKANQLICLLPSGIGNGPLSPWIFWTLWTTRNKLIFNKEKLSAEEALHLAIIRAKEWQLAQSEKGCKPLNPKIPLPPNRPQASEEVITCFTDASWIAEPKAGLGWVFKDYQDRTLKQGADLALNVSSPLLAEAIATLTAVEVAIASGYTHLSVASDSQRLVKALNLKIHSKELHGILHDILDLSRNLSVCSFHFIPRNQNQIVDALAKRALDLSLSCT
ncbi:PREDICTED: uncharacterized protein LOC104748940 [Camelina sativa]|uniref:Uncharacterized protein LOC104748940 n=1 Tax=Camelina sativa TaxID=90675 RepID=A0ABM0WBT9_CAMSA|nr:PREDICTED: uncharacterized protein LOC104748940 [Camelina sativa]